MTGELLENVYFTRMTSCGFTILCRKPGENLFPAAGNVIKICLTEYRIPNLDFVVKSSSWTGLTLKFTYLIIQCRRTIRMVNVPNTYRRTTCGRLMNSNHFSKTKVCHLVYDEQTMQ